MNRESVFLIWCMERYRYYKGLSGADVAGLFEKHGIYACITRHFEAMHTLEDRCIAHDIDDYISSQRHEPADLPAPIF